MTVFTQALSRPRIFSPFTWVMDRIRQRRAAKAERERLSMALALEFVRRSAAALEQEVPGAIANLDEATLEIASFTLCALAQVYGHFNKAPKCLRHGTVSTGFYVPIALTSTHMNRAWRQVIREARTTA